MGRDWFGRICVVFFFLLLVGVRGIGPPIFSLLTNCFLWVEVGALNDCRAASVGCFDDEVISVFEIYKGSPFFFGEVGEFCVAIRF